MTTTKRRLGAEGPSVFPIALGCMSMSGMYGPADDTTSVAAIHEAIERGVAVVIAVSWRNIESWRAFAGELAVEQAADDLAALDDDGLIERLGFAFEGDAPGSVTDSEVRSLSR